MPFKLLISFLFIFFTKEVFSIGIQEGNQPEIFEDSYKMTLNALPTSGETKVIPWSDTYWPSYKGGISYRWNKADCGNISEVERMAYTIGKIPKKLSCLSPAEKFDLIMGDPKWTLTNFERKRTQILKTIKGQPEYDPNFKILEWEGICHAWAPAAIAYAEPKPALLKSPNGFVIPFGSSDIKALLAFGIHLESPIIPELRNTTRFAGTRCLEDFKELREKLNSGQISRNEFVKRMSDSKCTEDINAGSFHIILTNQIGLRNQPFIIDQTRDREVWNQPVYSYEYKIFPFYDRFPAESHPKTAKIVRIDMKIKMIVEINPLWNARPYPKNVSEIKEERYQYLLELDQNEKIIGGKWISEKYPDFAWKKTKVDAFQSIISTLKPFYTFSISKRETELAKFQKIAKRTGFRALVERKSKLAMLELHSKLFSDKKNFNYNLHKELHDAVKEGRVPDIKKIKFWLRHGAKPDYQPGDEMGVINAIQLENLEILKLLVEAGGTVKTTLPEALIAKDIEILKFVLKNGADINVGIKFGNNSVPALHAAAFANDPERVKVLLDNGFGRFINWTDEDGENAIFFALWSVKDKPTARTRQTISLLIGAGIDVNQRNKQLYSPLSVVNNHKGPFASLIARDLIKNGASI